MEEITPLPEVSPTVPLSLETITAMVSVLTPMDKDDQIKAMKAVAAFLGITDDLKD